jgi:CheY-like chemotaxis protein
MHLPARDTGGEALGPTLFRCGSNRINYRPGPFQTSFAMHSQSSMDISLDVLLVEDSDLLRPITAEYLQELGHNAVAVANAEEALEAMTGRRFDTLLTDVHLPGMSGIALIREVSKRFPAMAIVVASGTSELTADILGAELGTAVSVLPKPYDMASMKRVLEEASLRLG